MFKKNYQKEIKVAQFAAAVAEMTAYHHGETSIQGTVINMAQDFVGSNNINLLKPNGAFGTRIAGGKDMASARYIFTELNEIAYTLFEKEDFEILKYLLEDSQTIEPLFYVPVVPMILINGTTGIGTGFSTNIPCFNIKDIIKNMKLVLSGKEQVEMVPWYRGFKGKIVKNEESNFTVYGVIQDNPDKTLSVTELPIGVWIDDYKEFLEILVDDNKNNINNYTNYSSESQVNFKITFASVKDKEKFLKNTESAYKTLKLVKSISTKNFHLFDINGAIKKYESAEEILREFVKIRLEYNTKRKEHLIQKYSKELGVFENKIRFLEEIIDGKIVVYKKTKDEITSTLELRKYDKIDDSYQYLVSMPIYSFQKEKIDELKSKHSTVSAKLKTIKSKSSKDILVDDLEKIKM